MFREPYRQPGGRVGRIHRLLALVLALCLVSLGSASPAAAHATFVRSEPPPNATLPTVPARVQIWFAEPLEPSGSTAALYDANGKQIAGGRVGFGSDPEEMTLTLPAKLPASVYTIAWQTLSAADGHELQGYFAFTVGAATTAQTAFAPTQNHGAPEWLQAASRWLALLGLAAAVAIWPIWLLVARPAATEDAIRATLARRARRFAAGAIAAAALGNV
ncbi:MAG TPA: copper resistance CopC family protein, partial [Thermomicrobiales bacterium]|nr:copper resistance CopC family protein [Thermomicrobiales bacterium]